eukprot:GFUD01037562.1.p1 GENE.GFUD01037562.1~~GFUD01037562.1.p1  ORF type:complete len:147 (+),score=64.22 GFUD01037562.1:56-496(+)
MNLPSTLSTKLVDYEPDRLVDYSEESDTADQDDLEDILVYIGPLTIRVGHEQIYEIFSSFGEVVDVRMVQEERKGSVFALVQFAVEEEAVEAVRAMDGGVIDYQEVIVSQVDGGGGTGQDHNGNWRVRRRREKMLDRKTEIHTSVM